MDEIEDPTLRQPKCAHCGLNIRSDSFAMETPIIQYERKTDDGMQRAGTEGIPRPKPFTQHGGWLHDDPRATTDHRAEPEAFGPKHNHWTDYQRQMLNFHMQKIEERALLGEQFWKSE